MNADRPDGSHNRFPYLEIDGAHFVEESRGV
jgi:hypothetical protein